MPLLRYDIGDVVRESTATIGTDIVARSKPDGLTMLLIVRVALRKPWVATSTFFLVGASLQFLFMAGDPGVASNKMTEEQLRARGESQVLHSAHFCEVVIETDQPEAEEAE